MIAVSNMYKKFVTYYHAHQAGNHTFA